MRISDWSSDVCSSDLFVRADPDHPVRVAGGVLACQLHHLGGADVESDDECLVAFAVHVWGPGLGIGDWGFGKAGKLADQGVRGIRAAPADRTRCPSPNPESPIPNPCSSPQVSAKPFV